MKKTDEVKLTATLFLSTMKRAHSGMNDWVASKTTNIELDWKTIVGLNRRQAIKLDGMHFDAVCSETVEEVTAQGKIPDLDFDINTPRLLQRLQETGWTINADACAKMGITLKTAEVSEAELVAV